jgi:mannonate dehydratase
MTIRLGCHLTPRFDGDFARFLKQYGVNDVLGGFWNHPAGVEEPAGETEPEAPFWTVAELARLRERTESFGLRLWGLENPVPPWHYDRIMLGLPGRDRQIDHFLTTIRQMAEAGIFVLGYHWMANPAGMARASTRTALAEPGRGGAETSVFDSAQAAALPLFRGRVYTEAEMWENYAYFIRAVAPVAEEVGVRLALHPADPPLPAVGGIPRLFYDEAGFQRAVDLAESPACGLNLCLGNWTAMGADIPAAIRRFGGQGRIVYGHVQGVQGVVPDFRECFLDEADCDFFAAFRALEEVGFDGVMIPAHFPKTVNDTPWQHHGHLFGFGYVRAMAQAASHRS